jgi:hypothetical protein
MVCHEEQELQLAARNKRGDGWLGSFVQVFLVNTNKVKVVVVVVVRYYKKLPVTRSSQHPYFALLSTPEFAFILLCITSMEPKRNQ